MDLLVLTSQTDRSTQKDVPDIEGFREDVFYEELRRQVLILTEDNNEDEFISCRKQGSKGTAGRFTALQPGSFFTWWDTQENSDAVPTWLVNLWRKGNGTGVFIPQIVKTRRRNRNGRTNNWRRVYRLADNN